MSTKKLILVIGATGAQGLHVVDALLAPGKDGSPSPYAVRALTRNPDSDRAKKLKEKGVEIFKGSFEDFPTVLEALKGCYGVWANTDGFTVGEAREVFAGIRIFELAKRVGTIRHYVWSNLDYSSKKSGYRPEYKVEHYDGKGRVNDFLKAQKSDTSENGMTWSAVTTGPYMDMFKIHMFGPVHKREDGTYVFATPIGKGHVAMIALEDLGYFARYTFDHREEVSGRDLEVASQMVNWEGHDGVVESFKRATGQKAVLVHQTVEEWMDNFTGTDRPVARDMGPGSTTFRQNFSAFWSQWRDDIITRDMDWIKSIHPNIYTVESWMRTHGFVGDRDYSTLKGVEDNEPVQVNKEVVSRL